MKKLLQNVNKGNLAMIIFIFVILGIFLVEVYSVTHIELKTQTAGISTVYDTISANALVVRNHVLAVCNAALTFLTQHGCHNPQNKLLTFRIFHRFFAGSHMEGWI